MNNSNAQLDAVALERLGLSRQPFDDKAVDGMFFPGGRRQEYAEQLQHLLRFSDRVLLLAGMEGSGRTTIRSYLVDHVEQDVNLCVIDALLLRGARSLLDDVLIGFGLEPELGEAGLGGFCTAERNAGRLCWLLIDDAQHLADQELKLLARMRRGCGSDLHLLLFGPVTLQEELQRRMPEDVEVYTITLTAFDKDEARAYLGYRFRIAGARHALPLNDQQLEYLCQSARGNLRKLHVLACEQVSELVTSGHPPLAGLPYSHLVLVSLMIIAVAMLYMIDQDNKSATETEQSPSISVDRQRIEVLTGAESKNLVGSVKTEISKATAGDLESVVSGKQTEAEELDKIAPSIGTVNLGAMETETKAPAAVTSVSTIDEANDTADSAKAATREMQHDRRQHFDYGAEGRPGGSVDADETYLLALAQSAWTVQLIGSHDLDKINSFREQYTLEMKRYRKLRDTKQWYVLVYGDFASKADAQAAVAALPSRLQRLQPWVRKVADIQKEIRQARAQPE